MMAWFNSTSEAKGIFFPFVQRNVTSDSGFPLLLGRAELSQSYNYTPKQ